MSKDWIEEEKKRNFKNEPLWFRRRESSSGTTVYFLKV